jgi:hypothetical protein
VSHLTDIDFRGVALFTLDRAKVVQKVSELPTPSHLGGLNQQKSNAPAHQHATPRMDILFYAFLEKMESHAREMIVWKPKIK